MNLKKMVISSIAALSIMGGSAFAANNANGTKVALDGTGDYLVYPYYAAVASWKTNIRVMNTNVNKAIVAKVVIRERMISSEKLDFLIYLTPGDVWDGQIVNENGKVVIKTSDDSFILPDGTSAADVPQTIALFQEDAIPGQSAKEDNRYGYVEVIGLAQIDGKKVDPYWVPYTKLDKDLLRKNYLRNVHNNSFANAQAAGWEGVDADSLTGQEVLFAKNQYGNLAMTLNATALEGVTGSKPNVYPQIGKDTSFSNILVPDQGTTAPAVIESIRSALMKTNIYVPFYDNGNNEAAETALVLTMPMKKYAFQINRNASSPYIPLRSNILSPMDWGMSLGILARDMKEGSTQTPYSGLKTRPYLTEIISFTLSDKKYVQDFTNGYARVVGLNAGIPVAMTAKNVEGTNVTNIFYPAYKAQ